MNTKAREYVNRLDNDTIIQIIDDYEIYEVDGMIGECTLRTETHKMMNFIFDNNVGINPMITQWMEVMIKEVYRRFVY